MPNVDQSFRTVATPFDLRGSEMSIRGGAPQHGEHTTEIMVEAGYSAEEIAALYEQAIIT